MKLFLQFYQQKDNRTGSKQHVQLLNGFHYIWDEVSPVWRELKSGCWNDIPNADEIYTTALGYATAAKVWEWAERSPEQKFIVGGPLVRTTLLRPIRPQPTNLIFHSGNAEELIGRKPDATTFKFVPPDIQGTIVYTYPFKTYCTWGRCRFCNGYKKDPDRQWHLEPLYNAPSGKVIISCLCFKSHDIGRLPELNFSDKTYEIFVRATSAAKVALINIASKIPTNKIILKVGVEFPSNRMLKYMRKELKVEHYVKFFNELHDWGYGLGASFITDWGILTLQDLEEATQFFKDTSKIWEKIRITNQSALIENSGIHMPDLPYEETPVIIGPFLVGYHMKLNTEQTSLNEQWKRLLYNNNITYCVPRYSGVRDMNQTS